MKKIENDFADRKKELGYYGKYYTLNKNIPSLSLSVLQSEINKEIDGFVENGFTENTVIKFKNENIKSINNKTN